MPRKGKTIDWQFVRDRLEAHDNLATIAKAVGLTRANLWKHCQKRNIPTSPVYYKYARLDAVSTARIYVEWEMGIMEIAEETGFHVKLILQYLRDRGVRIRSGAEQNRINTQKERYYEKWLESVSNVKEYF